MNVVRVEGVTEGASNVPVEIVSRSSYLNVFGMPGASRYQCLLQDERPLDALLLNRESEFLVVSLHGPVDRTRMALPRFEHLDVLRGLAVSSMYLGDPTLALSDVLSVGWYTGWGNLNGHKLMADWSVQAAECIGASYVIFMGSGAGGFAALQCATHLPHSVALAFNPQTSISARPSGQVDPAHQRSLVEAVAPRSGGGSRGADDDAHVLSSVLGDRVSLIDRYARPQDNGVVIVQNRTDAQQMHDHYLPFRQLRPSESVPSTRYLEYDSPVIQALPDNDVVVSGVECAMTMAAGPEHGRSWPFLI